MALPLSPWYPVIMAENDKELDKKGGVKAMKIREVGE